VKDYCIYKLQAPVFYINSMSLKIGSDKKLDEIINSIKTWSNKVDKLVSKLTAFDKRLNLIEETFKNKITKIEKRARL